MRPLAAQRTNQCSPSLKNPKTKTLRRGLLYFDAPWFLVFCSDLGLVQPQSFGLASLYSGGNRPFLMGLSRRIHAAVFSFMAGVIPPIAMLGRSLLYVQSHFVA